MAFEKRIASDSCRVVESDFGLLSKIFQKLGKSKATELEVVRTAREMGVRLRGLRKFCNLDAQGLLSLKEWSE